MAEVIMRTRARQLRIAVPGKRIRRLPFEYDGGRTAAGFTGRAGDCVVRAIAIATARPYRQVYDELDDLAGEFSGGLAGASAASGLPRCVFRLYLAEAGWAWHPTMGIGTGCTVHLRAGELPAGRVIARVTRHLCAVIDGVIRDTGDPSRSGTRCVYGYFSRQEN